MGTNPVNGNGYDSDDDTKIDPELQQFCENFTFLNLETCWVCNGYYGPSFGEPVCGTCHSFLFAAPTLEAPVTTCLSDDEDSGNDEPPYNNPGRSQNHDLVGRNANDNIELDDEDQDEDVEIEDDMTEDIPERNQLNMHLNVNRREIDFPVERPIPNPPRNVDQYLDLLSNSRPIDKIIPKIDALPTEVLLTIFSFLDDLSLANASEVCPRWKTIIQTYTSDQMWCRYTKTRWPLFQQIANVPNWLDMYSTLMSSCFCRSCLIEMAQKSPIPADVCKIRRLRNEIRSDGDATDGIDIVPLDAQMNHLQASIVGPQGSPYEGGKFFLYIVVGSSYPMLPPTVRFLTKILHPNVSRHGDVGIDIIQHNWSLALTISKILLSVQSLLTDPFTDICMEPELGRLYEEDRPKFEALARHWTWKYAMHEIIPPI